jgi:hypothetical protein
MNTLSENPATAAAMVSNSQSRKDRGQNQGNGQSQGQSRKKQKHSKKRSRNQENSDDSDTDNQKPGSKSKDKDSSMQCYYCCKHGHRATDCRLRERAKKIRKENRRKGSKDNAAANAAIATTTAETADEATIADAEIWACYTSAPMVRNQDISFRQAWHLDSGASDHFCNDKSAFLEIQRLPKPIQVRIGDNSTVPAVGIGTILLSVTGKQRKIQLSKVLYIPAIGTNLLSVSKLTDIGCNVQFSKNGQATIFNCKDKSMATAYRTNGMYCVEISTCFLTRSSIQI